MTAPAHPVSWISQDIDTDLASIDQVAALLVAGAARLNTPLALAVSGGCDSMVLLHAVARAVTAREASPPVHVLTFDHGTGPHATAAAQLVARECARLGLDVRVGRASLEGASEAEWRTARWRFFRGASTPGATIATAHTRDDHLETIVMRALRDAGARGLAGLAATSSGVARPFLRISRERLRRYGNARRVPFVEDPSNESRRYLRNRLRHDLLPAIERVSPHFSEEMVALADRAAGWRADVDALALRFVREEGKDHSIRVAREELATYDSATLCVLWPAIAARALVTLDRRGTLRLAQFTTSGVPGARMQLSGGAEVYRHRDSFVIRRLATPQPTGGEARLSGVVQFGEWRFRPIAEVDAPVNRVSDETLDAGARVHSDEAWVCDLPAGRDLSVRVWQPADRMRARVGGPARRVKRFFGDAQIPGPRRNGWPIVLLDGEIVWIPGVRRSEAASERSGRPVVRYACERNDGGPSS